MTLDFNHPPYQLQNDTEHAGEIPLILSIPHSGTIYPEDMTTRSHLKTPELRSSEDAFVGDLLEAARSLPVTMIEASYARAYVDLNRKPTELDFAMFDGGLTQQIERSKNVQAGLGVIPKIVGKAQSIYMSKIPANEASERLNAVYYPYHQCLQTEIQRLYKKFGCLYILDCHSMPSIPNRLNRRRKSLSDIVLGDIWGKTSDRNLLKVIETSFINQGYSVSRNTPYAGGFITRNYCEPEHHIYTLQLELCRDLYMDEETIEKNANFPHLKSDLGQLLHLIYDHIHQEINQPLHKINHPIAAE
ncbi:N-formylglutamate amidohydrolase [Temperatibacter marinus]|uniref:N-formylglutamate amidohydrolase n=1 Tax=Temperatibacter marinus TaxID=1456591 RepID=A0AA52EJ12_9PROT|nr:N-formylglutamate amidohydrolase [Temperatibacter marinus]WND03179.1 N-formylglutamate amidohydrolase [Temperatibacter marinus]